jgi:hypothetical protein
MRCETSDVCAVLHALDVIDAGDYRYKATIGDIRSGHLSCRIYGAKVRSTRAL